MKLRIMTYNIAGGRDYGCVQWPPKYNSAACAGVIKEVSPDIIGLNEVDFNHPRSGNVNLAAEVARHTGIPYESRFARALALGRPGNRGDYNGLILVDISVDGNSFRRSGLFDLCPECMDSLVRWFEDGQTKNTSG